MNCYRSGKRRAAKVVHILDDQSQASLRREVQVGHQRKVEMAFVQVLWELRTAGGNHTLHLVDYFEQGAQVLPHYNCC